MPNKLSPKKTEGGALPHSFYERNTILTLKSDIIRKCIIASLRIEFMCVVVRLLKGIIIITSFSEIEIIYLINFSNIQGSFFFAWYNTKHYRKYKKSH